MSAPLRLLMLEDSLSDAELILHELRGWGFEPDLQRVETEADYLSQLQAHSFDVILANNSLPDFDALRALKLLQKRGLDIPFIILSDSMMEELAVECIKQGAADYLLKDRLGRLGQVVMQAMQAKQLRDQQRQALAALRESEQRFRTLIENITDIIVILDADGILRYVSPSQAGILGYSPDSMIGKSAFEFVYPDDVPMAIQTFESAIQNPNVSQHLVEYRVQHSNGSWCVFEAAIANLLDEPAIKGVVVNCRDVTGRREAEEQMRNQAFYDKLTGLPNRTLFMKRLGQLVERSKSGNQSLFAVLFLDLDRFQIVKYSLGHWMGDQLLVGAARRLEACLLGQEARGSWGDLELGSWGVGELGSRGDLELGSWGEEDSFFSLAPQQPSTRAQFTPSLPHSLLARLGADEFAILLEGIQDFSDAGQIANQIHQQMASPFDLDGREVFTTTNIGIVLGGNPRVAPIGCDRPEDFLQAADTAMHQAKAMGKGRYAVFDPAMQAGAVARLHMDIDLRRALLRDEFLLHYQPIVSLETGQITGFEALVRWRHPIRGMVPPAEFIPVAEESGLIVSIGQWVLYEACRQMRLWQEQFPTDPPLTICVNLSSIQFAQPDLIARIDQILQETGLDSSCLKLEITESTLMNNTESITALLEQLKDRNIQLCIDDFGTGYSSLSYLHQFPVDTLKIDRSFVSRMGVEIQSWEIIRTIVTLAFSLGMEVIAEGVETAQQLEQLRLLKSLCHYGQGYFFSRPVDSSAVEELIAAQRQW